MDLKEKTKEYIVKTVLKHGHEKNSWRVLIIDEPVAAILTHLFTKSELLSHELFALQRIEENIKTDLKQNPVIYFLSLTDESLQRIKNDIKGKKYSRYNLCTINNPTSKQKKKIDGMDELEHRKVGVNFQAFQKNVFMCDFDDLMDIGETLKVHFNTFTIDMEDKCNTLANADMFDKKADLIVVSRKTDLFTPLLRFFTFMAVGNDFGCLSNMFYKHANFDFGGSKLFDAVKDMHMAEINGYLRGKARELSSDLKKIENVGTKELMQMVMQAPEKMQAKNEIHLLLSLFDECITKWENESMNKSSLLEQCIATKKGNYKNAIKDFMNLVTDEKVGLSDKFRIYLLLVYGGYEFSQNDENKLRELGVIQKKDFAIKNNLAKLKKFYIKTKVHNYKYENSKYKPFIYSMLKDFLENKPSKHGLRNMSGIEEKETFSLRKSEFVFQKMQHHKSKKMLFIYIYGGMTYEEISVVNTFAKQYGADICLGSDKILSFSTLIDDLREGNLNNM